MSAQRKKWLRGLRRAFSSLRGRLSSAVRSVTSFTRRTYLVALMVCGVAVVAISVAYASSVDSRALAVAVATAGSILGTSMFCLALPGAVQAGVERQKRGVEAAWRREARTEADLDRMRETDGRRLAEIRELERERTNLERQLRRQESMRVNVDSLRPVLKLALLEVDAAITDFYSRELYRTAPDPPRRGELQEYIGVVEASFKASLGVDLQQVRLREDEAGRVVISGITSKFQGFSNLHEDWKLKEVRQRKWGGLWRGFYRVLPDDSRVTDMTIDQRRSLVNRIGQGIDFAALDGGVKRIAREYLAVILSPLQRELVFVEADDLPGVPLLEFLQRHNRQVDGEIDQLTRRLEDGRKKLLEEYGI